LTARGYKGKKLEENMDSEIMQVLLDEARESYKEEIVVELKSESNGDVEGNLERIERWIEGWKKDQREDWDGLKETWDEYGIMSCIVEVFWEAVVFWYPGLNARFKHLLSPLPWATPWVCPALYRDGLSGFSRPYPFLHMFGPRTQNMSPTLSYC
jgi:hypothetical protein